MPYDLTSLQREANHVLDYTVQQTFAYIQILHKKKLITLQLFRIREFEKCILGNLSREELAIFQLISTHFFC